MQSEISGDLEDLQKVGPYRLEAPLGSGGMGTVWRAWDERLKRPVALKRILAGTAHKPNVRERFRREAEAEARLNHPSIVHIYDILETQDSDWIVMELVEGRTLHEALNAGPLPAQEVARLGREIAEGLAEAHRHGIVHRDLKAGNVMITPTGHAKVLDFGIAKQILPEAQETTLSAAGTVVGTFHAMSPEQALGLPVDARSDLFSLGSLLYEMATGKPPFQAETAAATLARVCSYRQEPVHEVCPEIPPQLSDLIDGLLEKDLFLRPQSATEVAAALKSLETVGSRPGELPSPALSGLRQPALEEQTLQEVPAGSDPALPATSARRIEPLRAVRGTLPADLVSAQTQAFSKLRRIAPWTGLGLLLVLALWLAPRTDPEATRPSGPYELEQEGIRYLSRFDKAGNLDAAIGSFEKALGENDRSAPAYAGLARACWLKFDGYSRDAVWLERARSAALHAVELDGDLAVARVSLALVHLSSGDLDAAKQQVQQALLLDPLSADAFHALARVRETEGDLQGAEAAHRKAIELRPDRMFFDELGSLYLRQGRAAEAAAAFRRSIELAPDGAIGYRNLSAAYYAQGDLAQAASQLQKALQIEPGSTLYANLGTIHFARGLYDLAAAAYEKSLAMRGGANNYQVWANLGDAYRWLPGKQDKAREAYRRAIQLTEERLEATPEDAVLRSRLALYRAKNGGRDEALAQIARVARLSPDDAYTRYRMAVTYEICGRRDQALAALRGALQAGLSLEEVKQDPELLVLREDVRYHLLIADFEPRR